MVKTTPFHPRLVELNQTLSWHHWAGYASPTQYQYATVVEYFATRNAAGLFDTSPLFKYRFKGPDATKFLAGVMTRDVRACNTGRAQYTIWCDDRGFVIEDGVLLHVSDDEYWLTAAEPNLHYFSKLIGRQQVEISDISEDYGILALQGPHSLNVLQQLTKAPAKLNYFGLTETKIAQKPVMVSRTGFTGDLGYEIWVKPADALVVWDALMKAGSGFNLIPIGMIALSMARIDAGLLMIDVDFSSSRYAWVDAQRETPLELGFDWMLRNLAKDDRAFIGRRAIEQEIANQTSRWKTVGLEVDPLAYENLYHNVGLMAPKADVFIQGTQYIYNHDWNVNANSKWIGYTTSFMFSPILKKHIAIGKVPLALTKPGSEVFIELTVLHQSKYVLARVAPTPFYNPARKTAQVS